MNLNTLACATEVKNTGFGTCVVDPKKIIGAFEVPPNKVFTDAELADIQASIAALVSADSKADRVFPIGGFEAVTDSSEEPVFQTLGYGKPVPVRDGNYVWIFQYVKGGICLSNALRTRPTIGGSYLFYDDQNLVIGTIKLDADGNKGLAGVPVDVFYPYPWKINDGTNVTSYRVQFVFSPQWINENLGFRKANGQLATLTGLQNINLVTTAAPVAGVSQIQTLTGCAQTNLYDEYGDELAVAALWTAYNKATGNEIAITSVVKNEGLKAFTVTLDSADPDYPATAAADITLQLASVTDLAAADIVGYESIPATIKRG